MIAYHFLYDLQTYYTWNINVHHGPIKAIGILSASLFLLLVGSSFVLSYSTTKKKDIWKKYFLRAGKIFALGCILSIITYIIEPQTYIRFGILHLIGVSIALLPCFARTMQWNWAVGILFLSSIWLPEINGSTLLIPLGFPPPGFMTVDYYPLLPWFGIILIGTSVSAWITKLDAHIPWPRHSKILTWPGRHTLLLYFIHQPVILVILIILLGKPKI